MWTSLFGSELFILHLCALPHLLTLSSRLIHGRLQLRGRHLEEDGGCSQIPGSKVIPVLLAKGERTRARVSGAEISFKTLTPGGRLEPVRRSEMSSRRMMYRFGLREEPQRNTHIHVCTHLGRQALVHRASEHVSVVTQLSSDKMKL